MAALFPTHHLAEQFACVLQLKQLVCQGPSAITAVSDLLRTVSACLEKEMPTVPLDSESSTDDFRPHIRHTLMHLDLLRQVFDLIPQPVTLQFSSQPQVCAARL